MLLFAVIRPDKSPKGAYFTMADAQASIAEEEPDVLKQNGYQIHPITDDNRLEMENALKIKVIETWTLEKFDGEYVGQAPVEVIEFNL